MSTSTELKQIPIEWLQPCAYQVRTHFDDTQLNELTTSIIAQGIIEPLVVRQLSSQHYEIVAGERRWRAASRAQLQEVPCLVRELTDNTVREIVLIENLQRQELNAIEEANALSQLIEGNGLSQVEIATQIGKSGEYVSQRLRLLKIDLKVQQFIAEGKLSAGHAVALASLPKELQWQFAEKCITKHWTVRQLEHRVKTLRGLSHPKLASKSNDPDTKRLLENLSEHFGAKVSLNMQDKGQGDLVIYFNSLDEFDGILEKSGMKPKE